MSEENAIRQPSEGRKPMGSRAAYREAVRRWGENAAIWTTNGECFVGTVSWLNRAQRRGWGKTWALAFADADKRAGK